MSKETSKKILGTITKCLLLLLIFAIIGVSAYFCLKACGLTTTDDFIKLKNELGDSFLLWFIVSCLQIIQVVFIPISNQIITVPLAFVFNDDLLKVFFTSWISIWLATLVLYFLGRWGGDKILKWLLNDNKQVDRCKNWLNKGWIFYPIGMLLPLPDDIITTLAGTSKMNFLFVAICSFITRGIDVACSVFGFGLLTKYWWGWLILAVGIIILIASTIILFKIEKKYDKR